MLKQYIILTGLTLFSLNLALANPFGEVPSTKALYGHDDRIDVYQSDYRGQKAAKLTVALVNKDNLIKSGGKYRLQTQKYGTSQQLCSSVRYYNQPIGAFCSGILIGDQYVLTAGHCNKNTPCADISFLLDYDMTSNSEARTVFERSQVYNCEKVIQKGSEDSGSDWLILELDRAVKRKVTTKIAQNNNKSVNDNYTIIGHPSGLPKKIAANGYYIQRESAYLFRVSLDSYRGNSGSPVFDTNALKQGQIKLTGILVNGNSDYVPKGSCMIENHCTANSTSPNCHVKGEGVTDINYIIKQLGSQKAANYFNALKMESPQEVIPEPQYNEDHSEENKGKAVLPSDLDMIF